MRKMLVIAGREYNAAVRTKSFVISLLILPLLIGGSVLVQYLLKDQVDLEPKRFGVVDRTPGQRLLAAIEAAAGERNSQGIFDPQTKRQTLPPFLIEGIGPSSDTRAARDGQRYELSERVRNEELVGFLEIGGGVYAFGPSSAAPGAPVENLVVRYQSNSPTYDAFYRWVTPVVNRAVKSSRYKDAGLPPETIEAVQRDVPLITKGLSKLNPETGKIEEARDENEVASILVPGGLGMLMFMLTLIGATPFMQGVVEEKMQRIAEVLLGSVRPFELMMGKLLGLVGISITLAAVYLGGAYWAALHYGFDQFLSPYVLFWFLVYLVFAVLMYGALFIAVGAACTDLRETQNMLWPVMVVAMLPMFVWLNVAKEPNSSFSTMASFVPTATPMLMLVRLAVPPGIDWWQPALGVLGVLALTLVLVYAAGRIFRVGILLQGKGASPRDLVRWVIRG
ncbi:MAG: ABC transporter permease [Pirellulales bacterium]